MKFKIGDKVRLTRNAIEESVRKNWCVNYSAVIGWEVIKTNETQSFISTDEQGYPLLNQDLELVPEEPEFKYWEEIEVGDEDWRRRKRIFLLKIPWNVIDPYVVVERGSNERFQFGESHDVEVWRYARKVPTQLTRKEVAEKFWVSENFVLVD